MADHVHLVIVPVQSLKVLDPLLVLRVMLPKSSPSPVDTWLSPTNKLVVNK